MTLNRRCGRAVAAALGALSICASGAAARADVTGLSPAVQMPVNGIASAGDCTHDRHTNGAAGIGGDGQGRTGGTENAQCQQSGLQFIGPGVGQVASVTGATIIGATINAPVQTSAGSAAANFSP